jgi:FKBP-type peptidyl-prolyl cis-trans isomerase (trigger factor)
MEIDRATLARQAQGDVTVPVAGSRALIATTALYRQSADIKGFRKGHVPSSVIEARYRKQIGRSHHGSHQLPVNEIMGE